MRIRVNGRELETQSKGLLVLKRELSYPSDAVMILNGFQTDEDIPLCEGDQAVFIQKGVMPEADELEAMMAARHTPGIHEKLKKAVVAVAGLGGLGSNIAVSLARMGVGRLILVDFDQVEPSNLNRQSYYVRHLGMYKAEAMKEQLCQINPFIRVDSLCCRVTPENIREIFSDADIVCEAFDRAEEKAMLAEGMLCIYPEKKLICGSGMAGFESANMIQTRRVMKNMYLCGDGQTEAAKGVGLLAPRVMVCAGHQANMAVRLILGIETE